MAMLRPKLVTPGPSETSRLPSIRARCRTLQVRQDKPWGYELLWAHPDSYAGKILHTVEGARLSLQYHEDKHETLYLLSGEALVELGVDEDALGTYRGEAGDSCVVGPGLLQRMLALSTCEFFEVSTPELEDVVRIRDEYGRE